MTESAAALVSLPAILVLEDGSVFNGRSIGVAGSAVGEVVFNTSMTGYQEILTDPSYKAQIITLTYPHIGNTGVNEEDEESSSIHASGLVIRDLPLLASSWRKEQSLNDYLQTHKLVAIADIDTRRLTRLLRNKGALRGCILAAEQPQVSDALALAKEFPGLKGMDLASVVTADKNYQWTQKSWSLAPYGFDTKNSDEQQPGTEQPQYHVVAYDFGVKRNILRMLADRGCKVTVVPAQTPAADVLAMKPDGVFLSNGPGDPEPCDYAISAIKTILETEIPVFGICLGYQLLALACGAKTLKMKFGHHGANHPVKDLDSNQVLITSQNHGFAVDQETLPECLRITHVSLFDGSLQGLHHKQKHAFGFQGHPEASPGPQDAAYLFDYFVELIETLQQ
ncbi:MAG: glutamine-hydrolyzing carbamoyl-phosphate synthase small subunit [Pseudomonadales bacterium]|nr:glutamine-hydrolyzing carbamoyl-phosphate synthase small subunit [Pseudomonadales bacterium]